MARRFNMESSFGKDSPKLSLPGKLVVPSYQNSGNFSILGLGDIVVPGLLLCFVLRFDAYKRSQLLQKLTELSQLDTTSSNDQQTSDINYMQPHKSNCCCVDCGVQSYPMPSKIKYRHHSFPFMSLPIFKYSEKSHRLESIQTYRFKHLIRLNRLSYFQCSLIGYFMGLLTATLSSEIFKEAQPALLFLVPFTLLPLLAMAYLKVNYNLSKTSNQNFIKTFIFKGRSRLNVARALLLHVVEIFLCLESIEQKKIKFYN